MYFTENVKEFVLKNAGPNIFSDSFNFFFIFFSLSLNSVIVYWKCHSFPFEVRMVLFINQFRDLLIIIQRYLVIP